MPGPKINILLEVGQARAQQLIARYKSDPEKCEVDPETGCWIFLGKTKTADGYGQVYTKKNSNLNETGRSAQTAFLLHRLAYLARTGKDLQDDGSHICSRAACFNPAHIEDENSTLNNSRKGCPGPIYCSAHGHLIIDLCAHTPQCIRAPRSDVLCCLALKESDPAGWASQGKGDTSAATSASVSFSIDPELMVGIEDEGSQEFDGMRELEAAFANGEVKMPPVYETLDEIEDDE